ncbi:MAG: membrane protein, putative [uncultured Sulfurovum sp.]|uniref:Membrane protein, putative n=1 Tax=uncultured Sulfurovum sp. TaxID=269237 RepID=A0A6S6SYV3_9BACT|nr:MAG: membrane protein, putative [uncultured Sulfurovum sp.]
MFFKITFLFTLFVSFLQADVVKPSYLEVIQKNNNTYSVLLKVAVEDNQKPSLSVREIEGCPQKNTSLIRLANGSYVERYEVECQESLKGKTIAVEGLESRTSDLLLRLEFLDNSSQSALLNSVKNSYSIEEDASSVQIIQTYTWLGITHILLGYDHVLFVFLLLLIVKSMRRLLWTISAFTLAHSLTMAGATLGLVHMPQQPVEAVIALSIIFLALEIMHEKQGKVGLTSQYPWIVAFIFGLLHGFGFAGALSDIGLPEQAITLALVFFNIGVELGQLIFVLFVVLIALVLRKFIQRKSIEKIEIIVVYATGGLASFWMIERVLAF